MMQTDGYDIELTRGDSLFLRIDLTGRELPAGTQALFSFKRRLQDKAPLLTKTCDASSGIIALALSHEETDITPAVYVWDVRLRIPHGEETEIYTPMPYAALVILDAVGDA